MTLCVLQDPFCFPFLFSQGAGKIVVFVQRGIFFFYKNLLKAVNAVVLKILSSTKGGPCKKIMALDYNGL